MSDYEKKLPSGRFIAKRGYAYYLYDSMAHIQRDDNMTAGNLERLNQGLPTFNRPYDGLFLARARKLSEIKQMDKYLSELIVEEEV